MAALCYKGITYLQCVVLKRDGWYNHIQSSIPHFGISLWVVDSWMGAFFETRIKAHLRARTVDYREKGQRLVHP
jgi:hypothetical protein